MLRSKQNMDHISRNDLTLEELVGEGAFGSVHKAKWKGKWGKIRVAIKKVSATREPDKRKLESEVEILAQLAHPNILKIYGACFENTELWIATEYIEGKSLYELLHGDNDVQITWDTCLSWAYQAAQAVNFLHSYPSALLHRDIKSLNFMVSADLTTVKLIDFGFAKFANVVSNGPRHNLTPRWGAPETLEYPPKWSKAADMYSLGWTFYEIVTTNIPFPKSTDNLVMVHVKGSTARPDLPNECPQEFADIICKCWDKDPKVRLESHIVVDTLRHLVQRTWPNIRVATPEQDAQMIAPQRSNSEPPLRENSIQNFFRKQLTSGEHNPTYYNFTLCSFGKELKHTLVGKDAKVHLMKNNTSLVPTIFLNTMTIVLRPDASAEFRRSDQALMLLVSSQQQKLGPNIQLFTGSWHLALWKNGNMEQGLSMLEGKLRHFFILPSTEIFTLDFKIVNLHIKEESVGSLEFDEIQHILALLDPKGKTVLMYCNPFLIDSGKEPKKVNPKFAWTPNSTSLTIDLGGLVAPVALVFEIFYEFTKIQQGTTTSTTSTTTPEQGPQDPPTPTVL